MARKILQGVVVKKSGDKTYRVEVVYMKKVPLYKKITGVKNVFLAHSEEEHQAGDKVYLVASRRFSKLKHFLIVPEDKIAKIQNA